MGPALVSIRESQGTPLCICNGMPKTLSAIAKLLRVLPVRIPFLVLTGTGLDDFDGRMIAAALENAPCLHGAGKTGSDTDRFRSRNPGPPLGGGREGRRLRVVEQPRRPGAAPALKALHYAAQEQAFSSRTRRPMNNEKQRHVMVCSDQGKHVFLAGTMLAKSLVDLTEPDSADV